MMRYLHKSWY